MSTTPSIKSELLNDLASYTNSEISKVRINGSYEITSFTEKVSSNNIVTVQYIIPISSGITQVTKVELINTDGVVITESAVYVPLLTDLIMKHTMMVSEG